LKNASELLLEIALKAHDHRHVVLVLDVVDTAGPFRARACTRMPRGVTFKWKDYRLEGRERYSRMTLATPEFIRRFLMHVLPPGFHRIRYYGLLASGKRAENIARARELLMPPIIPVDAIKASSPNAAEPEPQTANHFCPCCGA
jgi:hypothetical protein